jgi:hypothetical protein
MDTRQSMILAVGALLIAVATWLACRWWYGRQLRAAAQRTLKVEKARLFAVQQTLQARKQIESLQRELATRGEALVHAEVARDKSRRLQQALLAAAREDAHATSEDMLPSHGFADTQPML